jgi:hypothetical protein
MGAGGAVWHCGLTDQGFADYSEEPAAEPEKLPCAAAGAEAASRHNQAPALPEVAIICTIGTRHQQTPRAARLRLIPRDEILALRSVIAASRAKGRSRNELVDWA